jgi:hypothetical protein
MGDDRVQAYRREVILSGGIALTMAGRQVSLQADTRMLSAACGTGELEPYLLKGTGAMPLGSTRANVPSIRRTERWRLGGSTTLPRLRSAMAMGLGLRERPSTTGSESSVEC